MCSLGSFVEWLGSAQIDMEGEPECFVELEVGRRLMVLRHANGACHLLDADGRCSAYLARPAPCAAYPFAFAAPSDQGIGSGLTVCEDDARIGVSNSGSRRLTLLADAPCGSHLPSLGVEPEPVWIEAVASVGSELNEYVRIVESWNRQQRRRRLAGRRARTAEQYLEYLERGLAVEQ
jgi:Fe-S-cluster containining protein